MAEAAHVAELPVPVVDQLFRAEAREFVQLAFEDLVQVSEDLVVVRVGTAGGLGDHLVDQAEAPEIRSRDLHGGGRPRHFR